MAHIPNILIFMALFAITVTLAQVPQGRPHEPQGQGRRQAPETFDIQRSIDNLKTCDFTVVPRISCHDCHTKIICKQIGGILKACDNPFRPHCNNGVCSSVPSAECA